MAQRKAVLSLYKQMLRESNRFSNYNYREYALRRIRDAFRENKSSDAVEQLIGEAKKNLAIIQRQVVIGQLYRSDRLVVENNETNNSKQ